MEILGIDIGGSGIKGAPVDVSNGVLTAERFRIPTPNPSTPEAVGEVVVEIVRHFDWKKPVGCTFPAIVQHGVTHSAANVDQGWVHFDAEHFCDRRPVARCVWSTMPMPPAWLKALLARPKMCRAWSWC